MEYIDIDASAKIAAAAAALETDISMDDIESLIAVNPRVGFGSTGASQQSAYVVYVYIYIYIYISAKDNLYAEWFDAIMVPC